jgi:hypothetical protein
MGSKSISGLMMCSSERSVASAFASAEFSTS